MVVATTDPASCHNAAVSTRLDANSPLRLPRMLQPGDRVALVSPASQPEPAAVARGVEILESWGLEVRIGDHVFDRHGHYLAGRDEDRLADLNAALRDPTIRGIFSCRGGKGAYRLAAHLDMESARVDPKLFVGFSEDTILHLARWKSGRLPGLHGPHINWSDDYYGDSAADALRRATMTTADVVVCQVPENASAPLTTGGQAEGVLLGGNLSMIAHSIGWCCPSFADAILLVEAVDMAIGYIDRTLTQLLHSGLLEGVRGIAVGDFIRSGEVQEGKWSFVDVLADRFQGLGVPILGGLPVGHGPRPPTVPLGTPAVLDADERTLRVAAAVRP